MRPRPPDPVGLVGFPPLGGEGTRHTRAGAGRMGWARRASSGWSPTPMRKNPGTGRWQPIDRVRTPCPATVSPSRVHSMSTHNRRRRQPSAALAVPPSPGGPARWSRWGLYGGLLVVAFSMPVVLHGIAPLPGLESDNRKVLLVCMVAVMLFGLVLVAAGIWISGVRIRFPDRSKPPTSIEP